MHAVGCMLLACRSSLHVTLLFNELSCLCRRERAMRRGKEQRRGARSLRGAVSRSDDDELPALRLVDPEQRGGERGAEKYEVLSAVPLRRLQQSLHKG